MTKRPHLRHPLNAPGSFYVVHGECTSCMMPESEAPELMGFDEAQHHCYFRRQPSMPEEVENAISAVAVACCSALRYAGDDSRIIQQLKALNCEHQCDASENRRWWQLRST